MGVNDPAQDRYNPPSIGSEFDTKRFYELEELDIFYLKNEFQDSNLSHRKINQNQGQCIKTGDVIDFNVHDSVFVKI
tara:strand:+ start:62 stop:292 length:231 start_codon:yes stop_codon:yes gene_type:complete